MFVVRSTGDRSFFLCYNRDICMGFCDYSKSFKYVWIIDNEGIANIAADSWYGYGYPCTVDRITEELYNEIIYKSLE